MVVVFHNLLEPRINDKRHVGDRHARLGHVRRQDDLPLLLVCRRTEGVPLFTALDATVERHDPQRVSHFRRLQPILTSLDVVPAAHEHEDGALVVGGVPARSIPLDSRPNSLKINKETTHDLLSWRRVAAMA